MIAENETSLVGSWHLIDGKMLADCVCERIQELIAGGLVEVGRDQSGWDTLYRDPSDGRFWERTYPQGHLQGGGPPALCVISIDDARKKYGLS